LIDSAFKCQLLIYTKAIYCALLGEKINDRNAVFYRSIYTEYILFNYNTDTYIMLNKTCVIGYFCILIKRASIF